MSIKSKPPSHPGEFVRKNVIPEGMTVKAAAERLDIGRQALSDFLNGNSALSANMAVRLERAFDADRTQLLAMQAAHDQSTRSDDATAAAVRAYVPHFLEIRASQIELWAENDIDARALLPVLLRKLVHSTGLELSKVDFPGYDNSQRRGSDGRVEAGIATPWIPQGPSYWEFGTNKKPGTKANSDYRERLTSIPKAERSKSAFIFVTPRNWAGKNKWVEEKKAAGDWALVAAIDASDLEQWLAQSISAQMWFAEQLNMPVSGYETLENAWLRWANVTEPRLSAEIFAASVDRHLESFRKWLAEGTGKTLIVSADSKVEALAFLSCIFDDPSLSEFRDRTAVFADASVLTQLLRSSIPFIPIVYSQECEVALGDAHSQLRCIAIRPKNLVGRDADVSLELPSYEEFSKALAKMDLERSCVEQLARESGRSPTVLRRRLSKNSAIRTPEWASDQVMAESVLPLALVGVLNTDRAADREIVTLVSRQERFEPIEEQFVRVLQLEDCPIWAAGGRYGVVSKIDTIFATSRVITASDLEQFLVAAEYVLSESDPSLELPEHQRWAAAIYGKTRDHSGSLREGICESLVILALHGNSLLQDRLGIDLEYRVADIIDRLLTPFTLETLLSLDRDLPWLAEAAPDVFLNKLSSDLKTEDPVLFGLLKPVDDNSIFGSPLRTGLLWALECLAWNPNNLARVTKILAQLSETEISDNWSDKPIESLKDILRSLWPQTSASLAQRKKGFQILSRNFPKVCWEVGIAQIKPGAHIGHFTYRPRWRGDAIGAGQKVSDAEILDSNKYILEILVNWSEHDEQTLGDLVECVGTMPPSERDKVWSAIKKWSKNAPDMKKAILRERVRRFAFARRGNRQGLGDTTWQHARTAYESLMPSDPIVRHLWLFADEWVPESAAEIEDENFDFRERDKRIDGLRQSAMEEILELRSFDGVHDLLASGASAGTVGRYVTRCLSTPGEQTEFVEGLLTYEFEHRVAADWCLHGFLHDIEESQRLELLRHCSRGKSAEESARLLMFAPFEATTWRFLDDFPKEVKRAYWRGISPGWGSHSCSENTEIIDRLLEVDRPWAAFHAVQMNFDLVETSRLTRLLRRVPTGVKETNIPTGNAGYYISKALESLESRAGVSRDEMAELEFLYLGVLDRGEHGIPNLEQKISESPALFVQAVTLAYKRSDCGLDSEEFSFSDQDSRAAAAWAAHELLERISLIPSTEGDGNINQGRLNSWISEARRLLKECGREKIGDQRIGQLLAKAPAQSDDLWPCEPVCAALEMTSSSEIAEGVRVGVLNLRGAHWRAPGGEQEHALSAQYRTWAERHRFDFPFVAEILDSIAKFYERMAIHEDSRAKVSDRLEF